MPLILPLTQPRSTSNPRFATTAISRRPSVSAGRSLTCTAVLVATAISAPVTLAPHSTQTLTTQTRARNLHFWSWGYGYLYNVTTSLLLDGKATDALTTRTGFRETAFHDGMIFLNGRVLQVHGYAARSTNEWPALGTDVPPWISDFSNGLIVRDNGDLVRWMHVTPSKQDIESCDRVGLIESMPAGDAEGDPHGRQWQARVELMRDAIIYNRNNPSILFYESGNKGISEEHMRDMLAVRNEFDPHGGRAIGSSRDARFAYRRVRRRDAVHRQVGHEAAMGARVQPR